jgi:hypothetical protein
MGGSSIDLCWFMIMGFPSICMPVPALSRLSAISSFSLTTQANAIGLETDHQPESSPGSRPIAACCEIPFFRTDACISSRPLADSESAIRSTGYCVYIRATICSAYISVDAGAHWRTSMVGVYTVSSVVENERRQLVGGSSN